MTSLKTSIKTITYLSDTGCLEIQGASLIPPLKGCDKLRLELKLPEVVASVIIERDRERKLFVSLLPIVSRIKYA
ncbi:hypothetical protein VEE23_09490 [Escherichia coli]|nr:hypothetical protein VEE23_09490 [Escherichia coli]